MAEGDGEEGAEGREEAAAPPPAPSVPAREVGVGVSLPVTEEVGVALAEAAGPPTTPAEVGVLVPDAVPVAVGVALAEAAPAEVRVGVPVEVGVRVSVPVPEPPAAWVDVGVPLGVPVAVGEPVPVPVAEPVPEGVGVGVSDWPHTTLKIMSARKCKAGIASGLCRLKKGPACVSSTGAALWGHRTDRNPLSQKTNKQTKNFEYVVGTHWHWHSH